jgi:YfiH family protein
MKRLICPKNLAGPVTAFFTGKDPGADRSSIGRILGLPPEKIYLPIQKHTDKILVVGPSPEPAIADAVITGERGILIGVQVADCVPILLYEARKKIVGAVHAGWRGTAAGILKKTVNLICQRFYGNAADILVAIGPSIRICSYEVDGEVFSAVKKQTGEGGYYRRRGDKYLLDLAAANKYQAMSVGIRESGVWVSEDCTFCSPQKFFSYRYAKGSIGRQGGFIGILKQG